MDAKLQEGLRVEAATARNDATDGRPITYPTTVDIARAKDEVGTVLRCGEEIGQATGVVREVAVHLKDVGVIALECPAKAGEIGSTKTLFLRAMEHVHPGQLGGEGIGNLAGPVGRAIVDHEHVANDRRPLARNANCLDHVLEVLAFVIGRQTDDETFCGGAAHWVASCRRYGGGACTRPLGLRRCRYAMWPGRSDDQRRW